MESGIQNVLFIRTTLEDPVQLAVKILRTLKETREQRTRYLLRLIPVERTCKAFEDTITAAAKEVLPKWFADKGPVTFSINYRARLSSSVSKETAMRIIGSVVRELNPKATVSYKEPELVVNLELMKSNCCVSVLPEYFQLKKYNLHEVTGNSQSERDRATKEAKEAAEKAVAEVETAEIHDIDSFVCASEAEGVANRNGEAMDIKSGPGALTSAEVIKSEPESKTEPDIESEPVVKSELVVKSESEKMTEPGIADSEKGGHATNVKYEPVTEVGPDPAGDANTNGAME